ncbi:MAG: dihydrofolate reductase family protein [Actinobacteria bacterium]|nr:dihydrofolate reductase family protein [Actinomycetota bacterium]
MSRITSSDHLSPITSIERLIGHPERPSPDSFGFLLAVCNWLMIACARYLQPAISHAADHEGAREAAGEKSVSIAGGPRTLNQYLAAGLVDELRLHVVPFVAGRGERIFAGVGDIELKPISSRTTPHVTHLVYRRRGTVVPTACILQLVGAKVGRPLAVCN